ncbi:response regulator transcription factor [Aquabacterium sp.]|uniref:response regulator transcription factor n=1 Tax=Aquabacterium sp. TaxID=1872578 RepID=UPI0024881C9D|nr:response regulator transcription factor [Aquabacterium sp.]MDI1349899.1 response regulator transcription factor [Aquabacterium sp.]
MKLLLLEDDPILGEGLRDFLRAEGHTVDWAQRLLDARCLVGEHHDALLVDWQLPDGSGLDWVRSLRRQNDMRPILMLNARDLLKDRITGLESGADDYLVKPFEPEELLARLHAVHRRAAGAPSGRKRVGDIEIDLQARSVWLRQHERLDRVELTAREWQLLEALVNRSGRIVEKAALEGLVGGDGNAQSNVIEVHIANLRRKLGRSLIETVRGLGYRIPSEA